jgi:hypothetical protein
VHALDQLRIGAIGRIAVTLRLPRSTPVEQVADAAARATGRDAATVQRILVDHLPSHDRELVDLAGELARLEDDVRRVLGTGTLGAAASGAAASDPTAPTAAASDPDLDEPDRTDPAGRRP